MFLKQYVEDQVIAGNNLKWEGDELLPRRSLPDCQDLIRFLQATISNNEEKNSCLEAAYQIARICRRSELPSCKLFPLNTLQMVFNRTQLYPSQSELERLSKSWYILPAANSGAGVPASFSYGHVNPGRPEENLIIKCFYLRSWFKLGHPGTWVWTDILSLLCFFLRFLLMDHCSIHTLPKGIGALMWFHFFLELVLHCFIVCCMICVRCTSLPWLSEQACKTRSYASSKLWRSSQRVNDQSRV